MKKSMKYLSVLLFSLTCFTLSAQDKIQQIRKKLHNPNLEEVLVVAHRGDWRNAPENSISAIESAIKMGVDIVEIDVQRTKDGQLILMHDRTLDRTTNGTGKVADLDFEYIKSRYLRNGIGIVTRHRIPSLEEALLAAKDKIMLNLDKASGYFDEVYTLLEKTGTTDQIIMKGSMSSKRVKELFGKYLHHVIYMPVVNLDKEGAEAQIDTFMQDLKPLAVELVYAKTDNALPEKLAKRLQGKTLSWYNSLWPSLNGGHDDDRALEDPNGVYGYLIDTLHARIIQTDRPEYLIEYLKHANKRKEK